MEVLQKTPRKNTKIKKEKLRKRFILRIISLIRILQTKFPNFSKDRLQIPGSVNRIPSNYIFNLLPLPPEPRYYAVYSIENLQINFSQKLPKINNFIILFKVLLNHALDFRAFARKNTKGRKLLRIYRIKLQENYKNVLFSI